MELDGLYELLRTEQSVIPFVGAGLATGAGAPSSDTLAAEMARRLDVPSGTLLTVTAAAEARHSPEAPKEVVADIVARARLSPTPELRAIAANPTGRVLTTNYDRAIERAAEAVGREPVPLSFTDARALEPPADGTVHVVHLHGRAEDPPSIVLPGAATQALTGDETFALVARALMAQHVVLYLGFRLGPAEVHLRSTVAWLASRITGARRHVLMVRDRDGDRRGEELEALGELPIVDVVTYADARHAPVTQAALMLRKGDSFDGEDARPLDEAPPDPYVVPVVVSMRPDDDLTTLEYRLREVEQGREPMVGLEQVIEPPRTLLVAGPGLGKTELLRLFARDDSEPPAVLADLTELPGLLDEEGDPLRAMTRLLGTARAGRPGPPRPSPRALDGATFRFLLDGLDEVAALRRTAVAEAVVAAASHWGQHRWIVATRPDAEVLRLADADFRMFRILPSAAWARTYLEASAVPPERVDRATLQHPDLETLLGIPLYAQVVAERLRAGEDPPGTAFELLSEAQSRAVTREAAKRGLDSDELSHWLRGLAVGLELTGRGGAPVSEVAEVPGIGTLGPLTVRERLVQASLLADLPGRAAFPRRTVQELLCAEAILRTGDPAGALERVAVAEVDGERVLRGDMDFTLDLVFEAASRADRVEVRGLDKLRWARTVPLDDEDEAREAMEVICRWHEERQLTFGVLGGGALRGTVAALERLAPAWPRLVDERRAAMHADLVGTTAWRASNALRLLALGGPDPVLETRLPGLIAAGGQVGSLAVAVVGRRAVRTALPALREALLDRARENRRLVIRTLLELLDDPVEVATAVTGGSIAGHELYDVAGLLRDRLDADATLAVVRGGFSLDTRLAGWLIDRLLADEPAAAWTGERLESLALALVDRFAYAQEDDTPSLEPLAATRGAALVATAGRLLEQLPGREHGWDFLDAVDPALLKGPEHEPLRKAIERSREARAKSAGPPAAPTPDRLLRDLFSRLDDPPDDLARLVVQVRWRMARVPDHHRPRLAELSELWWPARPMQAVSEDPWESDHVHAEAAVTIGAALDLPLEPDQWIDLLDAPSMAEEVLDAYPWLRRRYEPALAPQIAARIAEAESDFELSRLIAAVPRDAADVITRIVDRLAELPEGPPWGNAVGLLTQQGDLSVRRLLNEYLPEQRRAVIVGDLAEAGDPDAQLEFLTGLISVPNGTSVSRPHWRRPIADARVLERLADLAIAAHDRHRELADFAVNQLSATATLDALAALDRVAKHVDRWSMRLNREELVRRIATEAVTRRLPDDLAQTARELDPSFGRQACC